MQTKDTQGGDAHLGAWAVIRARMIEDGAPESLLRSFERHVKLAAEGQAGVIPESSIRPVPQVHEWAEIKTRDVTPQPLAVIKLNGGLGTSMGLEQAKSLIPVKNGLTFLDLIVRQILALRQQYTVMIPLVLMNSFNTREDCMALAEQYPEWGAGQDDIPLDFLQHRVPKLRADDLMPVQWPDQPALEWCPPGHGNLYVALHASGVMDRLRARGIRYAFVSNADNLGALPDMAVPAFMADHEIPFLMEVADRTHADRKGGHLAMRPDGQLLLRESAQCGDEDKAVFQDVTRHRFFNTNNLWIDLERLEEALAEDTLDLPLIVNRKTVDPRDASSTAVLQLETAMGAAIERFEGAGALRVPRSRFAPVKTTEDLLVVRSDIYRLTDDARLEADPESVTASPTVRLDAAYYKRLADFEARFPSGAPSMKRLEALEISGDVRSEADVSLEGRVRFVQDGDGQAVLPAGSRWEGPSDAERTWRFVPPARWEEMPS